MLTSSIPSLDILEAQYHSTMAHLANPSNLMYTNISIQRFTDGKMHTNVFITPAHVANPSDIIYTTNISIERFDGKMFTNIFITSIPPLTPKHAHIPKTNTSVVQYNYTPADVTPAYQEWLFSTVIILAATQLLTLGLVWKLWRRKNPAP